VRGLTIHSSRSRFAARLNSSVRPHGQNRWCICPATSAFSLTLLRFAFGTSLTRAQSTCRCARSSSTRFCSPSKQFPDGARSGSPRVRLPALRHQGRACRWRGVMGKWRPNKSFKPNPLRGFVLNDSVAPLSGLSDLWRVGLIPALGRYGKFSDSHRES
jgi:hypothetical protein